jgi:hypothetical protein
MLKASEFIDRATRATFVEFTVYNANADMFVLVRLCVETTSSGTVSGHASPPSDPPPSIHLTADYHRLTHQVIPTAQVMPARLLTAYRVLAGDGVKGKEYGFMWCEFALYILALGYLVGEVMEVK